MAPLFSLAKRFLAFVDDGGSHEARERADRCLHTIYCTALPDVVSHQVYIGDGTPTRFGFKTYSGQQWRRVFGLVITRCFLESPALFLAAAAMLTYMMMGG